MRIAFFSPLPPAKSGVADYSEALLGALSRKANVEVFAGGGSFDPARFDIALYQVGNNADHTVPYETALRHPGVVVLHEANLHHLLCDLTIRRNDWDAYVREVAYDGGAEAEEHARRVRRLEVGPDYDGVPMLRRLAGAARGVIVHSQFVGDRVRAAGFNGPLAVIPHGAWLPEVDRMHWRMRVGLDEAAPLIGIFGYMKPYKRIPQSLRAFARLLRHHPEARLLMVGEQHPEMPLEPLIRGLKLEGAVRTVGYAAPKEFAEYLAACDIVLNLRHPTVGETSGTMLRALGMGKAVIVSDVGSFAEFPGEICLHVPVSAAEEDTIFEYLNLLVSRPELAGALATRARDWVARECNWDRCAELYLSFLTAVTAGKDWSRPETPAVPVPLPPAEPVPGEYLTGWAQDKDSRAYVEEHVSRLEHTLALTPRGTTQDRILEMGAYLQITPALKNRLGYGEVRGCYYGPTGRVDHRRVVSETGEEFTCDIDHFDAERDPFPYPDGHFTTVLCCELLEHLTSDPMHMMAEINRILRTGGHLVLTTPNIASLRSISAVVHGYQPGFFPSYIRPRAAGEPAEARHNREYTPKEIERLLRDSGFSVVVVETGPFHEEARPELGWVVHMLERYKMPTELRGDGVFVVGRKTSSIRERYPEWLYS